MIFCFIALSILFAVTLAFVYKIYREINFINNILHFDAQRRRDFEKNWIKDSHHLNGDLLYDYTVDLLTNKSIYVQFYYIALEQHLSPTKAFNLALVNFIKENSEKE